MSIVNTRQLLILTEKEMTEYEGCTHFLYTSLLRTLSIKKKSRIFSNLDYKQTIEYRLQINRLYIDEQTIIHGL